MFASRPLFHSAFLPTGQKEGILVKWPPNRRCHSPWSSWLDWSCLFRLRVKEVFLLPKGACLPGGQKSGKVETRPRLKGTTMSSQMPFLRSQL